MQKKKKKRGKTIYHYVTSGPVSGLGRGTLTYYYYYTFFFFILSVLSYALCLCASWIWFAGFFVVMPLWWLGQLSGVGNIYSSYPSFPEWQRPESEYEPSTYVCFRPFAPQIRKKFIQHNFALSFWLFLFCSYVWYLLLRRIEDITIYIYRNEYNNDAFLLFACEVHAISIYPSNIHTNTKDIKASDK